MRRIGRYILNGLTALSLVLCVATVGLWVRSRGVADAINYSKGNGLLDASITSGAGGISVWWKRRVIWFDPHSEEAPDPDATPQERADSEAARAMRQKEMDERKELRDAEYAE